MRSLWSGALSFGLVNIPVKVYSASEDRVLEFDLLHKKDLSPIRYARICKHEDTEVPWEDVVKGFEISKDEYVVLEKEDFINANAKKTKTIDIQNFVLLEEIDPIFFNKPYFLEPDKKAGKAYSLLREALLQSKKVAVASFVFHNKEHVGVVRPYQNGLLLHSLHYLPEIRNMKGLEIPEGVKTSKNELEFALALVDKLTESFDPRKYKDTYSEDLMGLIEAKAKGKRPAAKEKAPSYKPSGDLMRLLKDSLKKSLEETPKRQKASTREISSEKPSKTKKTRGKRK